MSIVSIASLIDLGRDLWALPTSPESRPLFRNGAECCVSLTERARSRSTDPEISSWPNVRAAQDRHTHQHGSIPTRWRMNIDDYQKTLRRAIQTNPVLDQSLTLKLDDWAQLEGELLDLETWFQSTTTKLEEQDRIIETGLILKDFIGGAYTDDNGEVTPKIQRKRRPANTKEATLSNGITLYGDKATTDRLANTLLRYNVWSKPEVVDVPPERCMRIPMLDGWEKRVKRKRVYPTGVKEKELIDKVFNGLQAEGKLE
ncbi:hypothetical protein N7447_008663 [Penicillium robsamsonii]|uniref:uncharacterized protein n=1 Tax=Penicillium robsamsonii TaxID=1792511 RepID=UPI002546B1C7|nr:uncharacterized protein N7447_008663 [Penicillium robsamsonii]KAJ5816430.1 hypothetical protein N7447_008663 [Penicillium robsamsonii]